MDAKLGCLIVFYLQFSKIKIHHPTKSYLTLSTVS